MSPTPLRSAYLRMEDGLPALVLLYDGSDGAIEVHQLRPAQLLSLAHDAAALLWSNYDLVERK